jgi:hypothetical protein
LDGNVDFLKQSLDSVVAHVEQVDELNLDDQREVRKGEREEEEESKRREQQ